MNSTGDSPVIHNSVRVDYENMFTLSSLTQKPREPLPQISMPCDLSYDGQGQAGYFVNDMSSQMNTSYTLLTVPSDVHLSQLNGQTSKLGTYDVPVVNTQNQSSGSVHQMVWRRVQQMIQTVAKQLRHVKMSCDHYTIVRACPTLPTLMTRSTLAFKVRVPA